MIVNPDRGLFFVATALMYSVSLYGAELSNAEPDPMTRIFVGEPNRLTLPPGFPASEATPEVADCLPTAEPAQAAALEKVAASTREDSCDPTRSDYAADAVSLPHSLGAASAKAEIPAQPISVGSAERIH
jgi:hypothetical protein